jgi:hypothetical protein
MSELSTDPLAIPPRQSGLSLTEACDDAASRLKVAIRLLDQHDCAEGEADGVDLVVVRELLERVYYGLADAVCAEIDREIAAEPVEASGAAS